MGGVVLHWDDLWGPVDRSQRWSTGDPCDTMYTPWLTACSMLAFTEDDDPRMGGRWRTTPRWAAGGIDPPQPDVR